jgi:DNA-directed RNA polymerase subunit N (RpoN/RPB10)
MIIPIRCFTCGKVLADKWEYYKRRCEEVQKNSKEKKRVEKKKKEFTNFEGFYQGEVLDELGLTKMCCRRHFLGQVDLIEFI